MDLSDGLADAVRQLAEASGTGARIEAAALPIHPGVAAVAGDADAVLATALAGGEDYELLLAVPRRAGRRFAAAARLAQLPVTLIGVLTPAAAGLRPGHRRPAIGRFPKVSSTFGPRSPPFPRPAADCRRVRPPSPRVRFWGSIGRRVAYAYRVPRGGPKLPGPPRTQPARPSARRVQDREAPLVVRRSVRGLGHDFYGAVTLADAEARRHVRSGARLRPPLRGDGAGLEGHRRPRGRGARDGLAPSRRPAALPRDRLLQGHHDRLRAPPSAPASPPPTPCSCRSAPSSRSTRSAPATTASTR